MISLFFTALLSFAAVPISLQNILDRPLYDMASNGQLHVVSADGVFLSRDRKQWLQLREFHRQNLAVYITKQNWLLVGDQISRDEGRSFHSYLRWDRVIALLQQQGQKNLVDLRLVDINHYNSELKILDLTFEARYQTKPMHLRWALE